MIDAKRRLRHCGRVVCHRLACIHFGDARSVVLAPHDVVLLGTAQQAGCGLRDVVCGKWFAGCGARGRCVLGGSVESGGGGAGRGLQHAGGDRCIVAGGTARLHGVLRCAVRALSWN